MAVTTINLQLGSGQRSFALDLDPARDATILSFLNGSTLYEPDIAQVMVRALRTGDVGIDVGANIGFFTALMATLVGPAGRVVSFEPGADNLARLHQTLALSALDNVTVIPQPASADVEDVTFYLNSDASGGHALWDPQSFPGNLRSQANPQPHPARTTTLDAEVARLGLPAPRLIKIDTEGAEHRVLQGARGLLEGRKVPFVVAELHEFGLHQLGSSQVALRQYMQGFGYAMFALYFDGSLPKLIPAATRLNSEYFLNVLFSTPEEVGRLWEIETFDPRTRPPSAS